VALAQNGQGTVTGTVVDSSQAIIPHADVTLTNTETGVTTKGQSSDVGIFYFGAVPIGQYRIVVNKQGFEEWAGTFTLFVGQNAVLSPILHVGKTATVVEVTGAAAPIDTQTGTVADIKESDQIRDLPLNGRQISNLFPLTAGYEGDHMNGMKVGALDFNMDGVSLLDRYTGGLTFVQPGIETIEEFRIETSGSSARFDQPATVIMATRSGTNQLHGAAYEYLQDNSVLGPTRLRTDPVGSAFQVPEQIRNEFGGYLSGPVYIPHLYNGKNKSFWFFDYEALRQRSRAGVLQPWVPTAAMWEGNLSNAVDTSRPCNAGSPGCPTGFSPITVYDPTTTNPTTFARTPFPNNQIPGPYEQTGMVLKTLTAPPSNGNNPYVAPNFTSTYPDIQSNGTPTIKWDQNISDKDRLSVRYTRASETAVLDGGYYANPISPTTGMGTSQRNFGTTNVAVNYNRSISPNWLNELLVGVFREPVHFGTVADFVNWDSKLGTPNPFGVTGWPTIYAIEDNSYFGWDSDNQSKERMANETIEDNLTWTHGKHTIQFGFRGHKEQNNDESLQQAQGAVLFGGPPGYTGLFDPANNSLYPDTGSGFAEMLLGLPEYMQNEYNRGYFYFRQTQLGLYISDKMKLTPRLTMTLGLRWEYFTPYRDARNKLVDPYDPAQNFEVITPDNVAMTSLGAPASDLESWQAIGMTWTTANAVGYPGSLFNQTHHDFGPRLGLAYQVNHNTVIRGSYGMYYVPEPLGFLLAAARITPPLNQFYVTAPYLNTNVPGGATGPYYGLYSDISNPVAGDYLPNATVNIQAGVSAAPNGNGGVYWDGKNWTDSHDQTWNITVEHELPKHTGLRVSYIGTYGGSLMDQYDLNAAEPYYNYATRTGIIPPPNTWQLQPVGQWSLYANNHTGYSRDHSLQVEVNRKFSNGLGFQAFYTYTRALTTVDPGPGGDEDMTLNAGSGSEVIPEALEIMGEPNLTYKQREALAYMNYTSIPPHRFTLNGIYSLPFGKGKHFANNISTPLDYLVGGWQVATIYTWNSGYWFGAANNLVQPGSIRIASSKRATLNIQGSNDNYRQWFAGTFDGTGATGVRGSLVAPVARLAGPGCPGTTQSGYDGYLAVPLSDNPANDGQTCYNAPFTTYNPAPRENLIGPGAWDDDLSLYKHFKIGEKVDMRFSADAFNSLNHPNDVVPNTTTGLQDLSQQANGSRYLQLSLRLSF
jgi:hypothetical protein